MKISTKGRYALRMLADLAEHQYDGFVALKDIAERQGVSKKYLEQIVPILSRGGILRAGRGYQGGYRLSKQPSEITVRQVLRLTEGSLAPVSCAEQDTPDCARSAICPTLPVWQGLYKAITDYLDGITLQDVLDQQRERSADNYVI